VAAALSFAACLKPDTKPPPGELYVTVSPSDAVMNGITTADGWSLTFDRVLVGIGNASLDVCIAYADTRYDRILDAKAGAGQKLVVLYGLGDCTFRYRIAAPSSDALLGEGVTDSDKTFMRTPGSDPTQGGVSVDVIGSATRAGVEERFHWSFRRSVRIFCHADMDGGGLRPQIHLDSNQNISDDVVVAAEVLFRVEDLDDAPLWFDPIAAADQIYGDRDGEVTLDELSHVASFAVLPVSGWDAGSAVDASTLISLADAGYGYLHLGEGGVVSGSDASIDSLAVFMQNTLVTRIVHFRDGLICPPSTAPDAAE
jgi:hypothetical protein